MINVLAQSANKAEQFSGQKKEENVGTNALL